MEIKKSYSPFGSTSLSVDEVLPDIQTGRAVYPDKDKEADASYMERINQYKHEGFHDVSEDDGSSGGASIPTPTVEDAGKSVVVNAEGQYALTNSGGGGTALVVRPTGEVTEDDTREYTWYDKTWQEVKDAYDAGLPIYLQETFSDSDINQFFRTSLNFVTSGNGYSVDFGTDLHADSADGRLYHVEDK